MEQENFGMDAYQSIAQSAAYMKNTLLPALNRGRAAGAGCRLFRRLSARRSRRSFLRNDERTAGEKPAARPSANPLSLKLALTCARRLSVG
ncbi:MAG: hypothetical protein WKG07_34420 [Hymenobacter sp.]